MESFISTKLYSNHINDKNDTINCCPFFLNIFLKISTWCSTAPSLVQPVQSSHFFDPLLGSDSDAFFGKVEEMSPSTKALDAEWSDQGKMAL